MVLVVGRPCQWPHNCHVSEKCGEGAWGRCVRWGSWERNSWIANGSKTPHSIVVGCYGGKVLKVVQYFTVDIVCWFVFVE